MNYFDNIRFLNIEYYFNLIYRLPGVVIRFFTNFGGSGGADGAGGGFSALSDWVKVLFYFVVLFLLAWIFYTIFRLLELFDREFKKFSGLFVVENREVEEKKRVNQAWEDILSHVSQENVASWSLAVIECDKILDELLTEVGFVGKDVGEKLKAIPQGRLANIQNAWDAHKVRNRISHEPGYTISRKEAKMTIEMYESVFHELGFLD